METHRFLFNYGAWTPDDDEWQRLTRNLSHHDAKQVQEKKFYKDKKACLSSKIVQRQMIEKLLPNSHREMYSDPAGKPRLRGESCVDWSVSHHGNYLLAVIARSAEPVSVGVDVARVDEHVGDDTPELFLKHMHDTVADCEVPYISTLGLAGFWHGWCIKESWLKATGVGLQSNLLAKLKFDIPKPPSLGSSVTVKWQDTPDTLAISPATWHIQLGHVDSLHCYAITSSAFVDWNDWQTIHSLLDPL